MSVSGGFRAGILGDYDLVSWCMLYAAPVLRNGFSQLVLACSRM